MMDPEHADEIWLVDPLDGTVNFAHGIPHFCVSVACWRRGIPFRRRGDRPDGRRDVLVRVGRRHGRHVACRLPRRRSLPAGRRWPDRPFDHRRGWWQHRVRAAVAHVPVVAPDRLSSARARVGRCGALWRVRAVRSASLGLGRWRPVRPGSRWGRHRRRWPQLDAADGRDDRHDRRADRAAASVLPVPRPPRCTQTSWVPRVAVGKVAHCSSHTPGALVDTQSGG